MTQIISVITREYSLLATDRRLTIPTGPNTGYIQDDDACKLVNLCNVCGIAYSGLSEIENIPTHKWIAMTLATNKCLCPADASVILTKHADLALSKLPTSIRRQAFLITGWAYFNEPPELRSHFCLITNAIDKSGNLLNKPFEPFECRVRALPDNKPFLWFSVGVPLQKARRNNLERNLRKLVAKKISPKEALRLLVEEIIHTSVNEKAYSVGDKVLGFCIPKDSALLAYKTGNSMMLANQPNLTNVTFTYFDPSFSELQQHGPTYICGEFAATDIKTESDPATNFQSSEMRILSIPNK